LEHTPVRGKRKMLDLLLLLGLSAVGAGALWMGAQAIILGGGLLGRQTMKFRKIHFLQAAHNKA
jgi:hypothetical protein